MSYLIAHRLLFFSFIHFSSHCGLCPDPTKCEGKGILISFIIAFFRNQISFKNIITRKLHLFIVKCFIKNTRIIDDMTVIFCQLI